MRFNNLSLIVAVSKNNVIGVNNGLPWSIKEDLKLFKKITIGKDIIMGRNTFLSLPFLLPKRTHHVLTTSDIDNTDILKYNSLEDIFKIVKDNPEKEFVVIGGGTIYNLFLPFISKAYISYIDLNIENGDTFFKFTNIDLFKVIYEEEFNEFTFKEYKLKEL